MPRSLLRLLAFGVAAIVLVPRAANAQDPVPAPPPAQPVPLRPAQPTASVPSAPPAADGPIVRTTGEYSCAVTDRGALEDLEARTAADVVCGELAKQKAPVGRYTIRFGRLGSRTRFAVASGEVEREVWIASLDELSVAAARVIEALLTRQTVSETEKVDSVLSSETATRRTKPGQLSVGLGIIGMTSAGAASGVSTGAGVSLQYHASRYGLFAEGRLAGIGSAEQKLWETSLGIGGQLFFSDTDFSPFVGAGLQIAAYGLTKHAENASGLGTFGEIGLAGLRSSKVGVFVTVRAAVPFFAMDSSTGGSGKAYVVPMSLNLGLTFL